MLYTNLLDNVPTTFYANHVMNVSKRIIIIFTNISVMMKPKTISSRFLSLQKNLFTITFDYHITVKLNSFYISSAYRNGI